VQGRGRKGALNLLSREKICHEGGGGENGQRRVFYKESEKRAKGRRRRIRGEEVGGTIAKRAKKEKAKLGRDYTRGGGVTEFLFRGKRDGSESLKKKGKVRTGGKREASWPP